MIFKVENGNGARMANCARRVLYLRYRIGDMPVDKWKSLGVTDFQVATKNASASFRAGAGSGGHPRTQSGGGMRRKSPCWSI